MTCIRQPGADRNTNVGALPTAATAHAAGDARPRSRSSRQHRLGSVALQDWFRPDGIGQVLGAAREVLAELDVRSPAAERAIFGKTAIRWYTLDTTRLTASG